jgi:hypothetical protein
METAVKAEPLAMIAGGAPTADDDDDFSHTSERASTVPDNSTSNGMYKDREKEVQIEIARKEERSVRVIRIITFVCILLCAVAVCGAVFYFAKASDQSNFELEVRVNNERV